MYLVIKVESFILLMSLKCAILKKPVVWLSVVLLIITIIITHSVMISIIGNYLPI